MLVKCNSNLEISELRRMLGNRCPACSSTLDKHRYALIGRTVASTENSTRLKEFFDRLTNYDWQKVKEFRDFDGASDMAETHALKCVTGAMVLINVRDPVELFESSSILNVELLGEERARDLEQVIEPQKWRLV
jgi:hypothetical protein